MYLIDFSAWIRSFRKDIPSSAAQMMRRVITAGEAATCNLVMLEVLQGCRNENERDRLCKMFKSLRNLAIDSMVWEFAYELGYTVRRNGLTVPTVDLVIASTAIGHHVPVLHVDRHFQLLAEHVNLEEERLPC